MNRAQQRQKSPGGFLGVLLAANPEIAKIVGVRSRAVVRRTWVPGTAGGVHLTRDSAPARSSWGWRLAVLKWLSVPDESSVQADTRATSTNHPLCSSVCGNETSTTTTPHTNRSGGPTAAIKSLTGLHVAPTGDFDTTDTPFCTHSHTLHRLAWRPPWRAGTMTMTSRVISKLLA